MCCGGRTEWEGILRKTGLGGRMTAQLSLLPDVSMLILSYMWLQFSTIRVRDRLLGSLGRVGRG